MLKDLKRYTLENDTNVTAVVLRACREFLARDKMFINECWNIYTIESNKEITWFHKLAALKLAKECNEALFRLTAEGPSVMYVKLLECMKIKPNL